MELGDPQVGEITRGGAPHLSCKRDKIKTKDYMDRKVTSPKRVNSTTWGPPPPRKQALRQKPTHSTAHTSTFEQFPQFHVMRGLPIYWAYDTYRKTKHDSFSKNVSATGVVACKVAFLVAAG